MTLIFRNLIHVIRRFKLATVLNILGLSVAFASFIIIMMQLNFHFTFDRFHKDYDKIFRIEAVWNDGRIFPNLARPLSELFFDSSPHIVAGTRYQSVRGWTAFFAVENNGVRNYFREKTARITPEFTDVFTVDFVEGSANALQTPNNVMIPLSMARRLFGYESAIGRHLIHTWGTQTVGAVFRDFPANSTFQNVIYSAFPEEQNRDNWQNWNYHVYIRVNQANITDLLIENFKQNFDFETAFGSAEMVWSDFGVTFRLTTLSDLHFTTDVFDDGASQSTSRQTLMILFAIAIVIIVIASINFTNFSTALSPMRVRNINTQRVLGAQQRTIRFSLVFEAIAFSLVSYLVALLLVRAFADSMLANLLTADLTLSTQPLVVGGTALVALLAGLLAGFYPSRYMTSFAPALALKGNFALSPKGKQLRNILIGIQYIASFALIIGASFMYLQNQFMKNSDLGYDTDALIIVNMSRIQQHRDAFTHRLQEFAGITGVTYAEQVLASTDHYMGWGRSYEGETINFQVIPVRYDFLQIMGIEVTEGRDFRREDAGMELGVFIFNETARQRFNLELNISLEGQGEIIGFMPDIRFASSRMIIDPMAFYVWGTQNWGDQLRYAYIQLSPGANLREAMTHVRNTLEEFDPNYPFQVRFFDEVLQRTYESERNLSRLILLFSLIAIFISIVGVFGLVVFDSECRRKEIGIRKVHGASTLGIILMFNQAYIKILVVCFVIATPLAWFAVSRWLENFAFRTPLYWWVFALAFVAVSVITVLTVTIQNWRVANDNPVKSIKTE